MEMENPHQAVPAGVFKEVPRSLSLELSVLPNSGGPTSSTF